jgi:hypothetical protein
MMGTWDTSEDKLVSDIACMFFDSQTVKSVPSDYARAVIAAVREVDAARRKAVVTVDDPLGADDASNGALHSDYLHATLKP